MGTIRIRKRDIGKKMQIVMTLVFTSALLVFMIYPAIKIVGYLETKMEISSDISQYAQLISTLYPDYAQYLSVLEGGTVKLTLNKK